MGNKKQIITMGVLVLVVFFLSMSCVLLQKKSGYKDKYHKNNAGKIVFSDQAFTKRRGSSSLPVHYRKRFRSRSNSRNYSPALKREFTLNDNIYMRIYYRDTLKSCFSDENINCKEPSADYFYTMKINNHTIGFKKRYIPRAFILKPRTGFYGKEFREQNSYDPFSFATIFDAITYKEKNSLSENILRNSLNKLRVGKNKIQIAMYSHCSVRTGRRRSTNKFLSKAVSKGTFILTINSQRELDTFVQRKTRNFPPSDYYFTKDRYRNKKEFQKVWGILQGFRGEPRPVKMSLSSGWTYVRNSLTGLLINRNKNGYIVWNSKRNNECRVSKFNYRQDYFTNGSFDKRGNINLIHGFENAYWIPCNKL